MCLRLSGGFELAFDLAGGLRWPIWIQKMGPTTPIRLAFFIMALTVLKSADGCRMRGSQTPSPAKLIGWFGPRPLVKPGNTPFFS